MQNFTAENIRDFDLDHIFQCGQCFRWERQPDGTYDGVAKGRIVNVRYELDAGNTGTTAESVGATADASGDGRGMSNGSPSGKLTITPCTKEEFENIWRPYFDLDRDYAEIKRTLSDGDSVMAKASAYGYGIRLLKQDLWETIVSFIISQNNNIPRIKGCIERLCENFGEPISPGPASGGTEQTDIESTSGYIKGANETSRTTDQGQCDVTNEIRYDIPTPEKLASLTEEDLAPVRLGYRAKYIIETAKTVCEKGLPSDFDELSALCGVGPKVANCISLFGMQDYASFPIDVWVMKVMHELYGIAEKDKKQMAEFAREKFGDLGGFAQQYLFYYMRDRS